MNPMTTLNDLQALLEEITQIVEDIVLAKI
jgi:hypothetical protein